MAGPRTASDAGASRRDEISRNTRSASFAFSPTVPSARARALARAPHHSTRRTSGATEAASSPRRNSVAETDAALTTAFPGARLVNFGHLGDGNLHYNVFPPKGVSRDVFDAVRGAVKQQLHDLTNGLGGSVSAEHGIGRLKTGDMLRYVDPVKLGAMRAIKAALDPLGILNPGAVLPAEAG